MTLQEMPDDWGPPKIRLPAKHFPTNTQPSPLASPAVLVRGVDFEVWADRKRIQVLQCGSLAHHLVRMCDLYSAVMHEFDQHYLMDYEVPMTAVTQEIFKFSEGWGFFDEASRRLVTEGAWTESPYGEDIVYLSVRLIGDIPANEPVAYQWRRKLSPLEALPEAFDDEPETHLLPYTGLQNAAIVRPDDTVTLRVFRPFSQKHMRDDHLVEWGSNAAAAAGIVVVPLVAPRLTSYDWEGATATAEIQAAVARRG